MENELILELLAVVEKQENRISRLEQLVADLSSKALRAGGKLYTSTQPEAPAIPDAVTRSPVPESVRALMASRGLT
jgi:hypothetical protein